MIKSELKNTIENKVMFATLDEGEQYQALQSALQKLSDEDRENINRMASELVDTVKAKCPNTQFSRNSALMLLSRIGAAWNG